MTSRPIVSGRKPLLLAILMAASALTGCGDKESNFTERHLELRWPDQRSTMPHASPAPDLDLNIPYALMGVEEAPTAKATLDNTSNVMLFIAAPKTPESADLEKSPIGNFKYDGLAMLPINLALTRETQLSSMEYLQMNIEAKENSSAHGLVNIGGNRWVSPRGTALAEFTSIDCPRALCTLEFSYHGYQVSVGQVQADWLPEWKKIKQYTINSLDQLQP